MFPSNSLPLTRRGPVNWKSSVTLVALAGGGAVAPAQEQIPTFQTAQVFQIGSTGCTTSCPYPWGVATGKLTGKTYGSTSDAFEEVVVAIGGANWMSAAVQSRTGGAIAVFRNQRNLAGVWQGLSEPDIIELGEDRHPAEIVVADMDEDGDKDIICTLGHAVNPDDESVSVPGIMILFNQGNGVFSVGGSNQSRFFPTPWPLRGLAVADFYIGDGANDFAVTTDLRWRDQFDPFEADKVRLYNNLGDGSRAYEIGQDLLFGLNSGLGLGDIVAGHFNTNGSSLIDLTTGNYDTFNSVTVLTNHYPDPWTFENVFDTCEDPAYSYFSIATANFGPITSRADLVGVKGASDGYLYVSHGNGQGQFTQHCTTDRYFIGSNVFLAPRAVATSTALNSGGTADVAVTNGTNVVLLLGRGDGTFQFGPGDPQYTFSMGSVTPTYVALPDLNNDGCADLLTTNHPNHSFSVRLNLNCNNN
jgi:FG-GAP-like repeat